MSYKPGTWDGKGDMTLKARALECGCILRVAILVDGSHEPSWEKCPVHAAAPEMLEALKEVVTFVEPVVGIYVSVSQRKAWHMVRDAIAKATGSNG
jgi:hypothetical protein